MKRPPAPASRKLPRPFAMPWGKGQITEEAQVARDHWEPTIQLMEYEDGSKGLRFCFYSRGRFNRSPMMLGEEDLDDLTQALEHAPAIRAMLARLTRPAKEKGSRQPGSNNPAPSIGGG